MPVEPTRVSQEQIANHIAALLTKHRTATMSNRNRACPCNADRRQRRTANPGGHILWADVLPALPAHPSA